MDDRTDAMVVSTHLRGSDAVIELDGELDLYTSPLLTTTVDRLLAAGATTVELDAAALTFTDSSGLCALLTSRRRALGAGAVIHVAKASAPLDRMLTMTGLREMFTAPG
jgi:anti-sigma B factor antagonist